MVLMVILVALLTATWVRFGLVDNLNFDVRHTFTIEDASADLNSNNGWTNWTSIDWSDWKFTSQSGLLDVCMISSQDGWAVGNLGLILHWNGSVWQRVPSPVGYDLHSVSMASSDNGWILGAAGTVLQWDGVNWSSYSLPLPHTQIKSIHMISPDNGWAVGESWSIDWWTGDPYNYLQNIFRWNGESWSIVRQSNESALSSIFMLNSNSGWVVGEGGLILRWDGVSWSSVVSPTKFRLNEIFMLNGTDGWAVGANGNNYFMMANGTLLTSGNDPGTVLHWDGRKWTLVSSPITPDLRSIYMVNSKDGWAVGEHILHWNGNAWSMVSDPLGDDGSYYSISMTSSNEGWIAGSQWVHNKVTDTTFSASPRARMLYYGDRKPVPPPSPSPNPSPSPQTDFYGIALATLIMMVGALIAVVGLVLLKKRKR
jgi:photosystem II stability/assembly factor-like uncharacterized protein